MVVLRTDNEILYPRLEKRNYAEKKITENVTAEIMQVCLNIGSLIYKKVVADEARDSYKENIIWELQSNSLEDMERNIARISEWIIAHQ